MPHVAAYLPWLAYSPISQWRKKRDEEREKERQRREAERKARDAKRAELAEQRRLKDEERAKAQREFAQLKRLNPHEDEIASCEVLIAYLSSDKEQHEKKRCVQLEFGGQISGSYNTVQMASFTPLVVDLVRTFFQDSPCSMNP